MHHSEVRVVDGAGYSMHGVNQGLAFLVEVRKDIKLAEFDVDDSVLVVGAVVADVHASNFVLFVEANLGKSVITKL